MGILRSIKRVLLIVILGVIALIVGLVIVSPGFPPYSKTIDSWPGAISKSCKCTGTTEVQHSPNAIEVNGDVIDPDGYPYLEKCRGLQYGCVYEDNTGKKRTIWEYYLQRSGF